MHCRFCADFFSVNLTSMSLLIVKNLQSKEINLYAKVRNKLNFLNMRYISLSLIPHIGGHSTNLKIL